MKTVLITGASGLIGRALAASLSETHQVVAMSRRQPSAIPQNENHTFIKGDFTSWEALTALDVFRIDALVHLGAVTGGCSERDGMLVNVEGTRVLLQYLASRSCRKMVLASSIAVVGIQRNDFIPDQLPITETHGCKDKDGYGFSKYMMEETTRYLCRQNTELDILNIRLSSVPASPPEVAARSEQYRMWGLGGITILTLGDAVDLFTRAVQREYHPGLNIINGVSKNCWCTEPTARLLRRWWDDKVDLSWYEKPENRFASVYSSSQADEVLGFQAEETMGILRKAQEG